MAYFGCINLKQQFKCHPLHFWPTSLNVIKIPTKMYVVYKVLFVCRVEYIDKVKVSYQVDKVTKSLKPGGFSKQVVFRTES